MPYIYKISGEIILEQNMRKWQRRLARRETTRLNVEEGIDLTYYPSNLSSALVLEIIVVFDNLVTPQFSQKERKMVVASALLCYLAFQA